jgi:hypothetical protein
MLYYPNIGMTAFSSGVLSPYARENPFCTPHEQRPNTRRIGVALLVPVPFLACEIMGLVYMPCSRMKRGVDRIHDE